MEEIDETTSYEINKCIEINASTRDSGTKMEIKTNIIYKVEDKLEEFSNWKVLYSDSFVTYSFKDPYLYININKECPEDDDLEKMFTYLCKFYDENQNLMFGKIYNLSNMGMVSISDIHTFSKSINTLREKTNKQVYSSSIIIKNAIVKTVLDMFLKLYKNTRPIKVVNNVKDAKLFIKDERRKYRETNQLRSIDPDDQGVF